jgi:hypothetical protein
MAIQWQIHQASPADVWSFDRGRLLALEVKMKLAVEVYQSGEDVTGRHFDLHGDNRATNDELSLRDTSISSAASVATVPYFREHSSDNRPSL